MKYLLAFILFFMVEQNVFSQTNKYSQVPPLIIPSSDNGFEMFANAAKSLNDRVEKNVNGLSDVTKTNSTIIDVKLKSGCGNNIIDYYNGEIAKIKKTYSISTDADLIKFELERLSAKLINFDCNNKKSYTNFSTNNEVSGRIGITKYSAIIWSNPDIMEAYKVTDVDKNIKLAITGLINDKYYEVRLLNGKKGYINKSDIELE